GRQFTDADLEFFLRVLDPLGELSHESFPARLLNLVSADGVCQQVCGNPVDALSKRARRRHRETREDKNAGVSYALRGGWLCEPASPQTNRVRWAARKGAAKIAAVI